MSNNYATVREFLGEFVGRRVVDITQHDPEFFLENSMTFVDLMFDSGDVLRFYQQQGVCFAINPDTDGEAEIFNE